MHLDLSNGSMVWIIAVGVVLVIFFLMGTFARLYRKAGPHEALVVYGMRRTRVIKGRGTVIYPMMENWRRLSLELMSFDVAPKQDLYTKQGVAVTVEAVAQIKVKSDDVSVLTAAEQFLTKSDNEREGLIRLVMEGHLRGIIGQLTVEEIVKEPEMVSDRMRSTCADDMNKMGLEVISFTIKEVRDKNEYITNMGRPDVARIKRDADVATAEADRDTAIRRAVASREAAVAKAQHPDLGLDATISIGCLEAMEIGVFMRRAINEFKSSYPGVKVVLERHSFKALRQKLIHGDLDLDRRVRGVADPLGRLIARATRHVGVERSYETHCPDSVDGGHRCRPHKKRSNLSINYGERR